MKSFKVLAKTYVNKKTNVSFITCKCKGEYLPLATADKDVSYTIKFSKVPDGVKVPSKDGIYSIGCENEKLWIDSRPDFKEKHIARCVPNKIVFEKDIEYKQSNEERVEPEI